MGTSIFTFQREEDLVDWFNQAESDFFAHIDAVALPADNAGLILPFAAIDGATAQLQLWWINAPTKHCSEMLWDFANVDSPSGQNLLLIRSAMERVYGEDATEIGKKVIRRRPLSQTPQFIYHPMRYRALNPLGAFAERAGTKSAHGGFTQEILDGAYRRYFESQTEYMSASRLRYSVKVPQRLKMNSAVLASFLADFCHYGKQIFDFPGRMVELFHRTDVDGIPLDLINLPHFSQYLYFGPQKSLTLDSGWAPDGAYVSTMGSERNRVIQFALTFAPPEPEEYESAFDNPEPCYVMGLSEEKFRIGIGEAVDLALSDKIATLRKQVAHGSSRPKEEVEAMFAGDGRTWVDATSKFAQQELVGLDQMHKAWEGMLRLVVNGLAYLSTYGKDWQHKDAAEMAPAAVLSSIPVKPGKEYKRKSKLAELGYSAIHLCGMEFRDGSRSSSQGTHEEAEGETAFTWVRGHWRSQAHGPKRGLRRLQWTMPFRRRVGKNAGAPEGGPGHIYLVEGDA